MEKMNITASEVLDAAGTLIEQDISEEVMLRWIRELDCRVQSEIMGKDAEGISTALSESDSLCVPRGYDRMYLLYVKAMAELYRGDAESYAAANRVFNEAYGEYARFYLRNRA